MWVDSVLVPKSEALRDKRGPMVEVNGVLKLKHPEVLE